MDKQVRTVTVGNAGRSLPGLRPLRDVEAELRPGLTPREIAERDKPAEEKGFIEQGIEATTGLANQLAGRTLGMNKGLVPGSTVEKLAHENPVSKDERMGVHSAEAAKEEVEHKVESLTDWTSRIGYLLSGEGLKRLGLIIAGGLLLIFAFFLLVHAMGGPTPSVIPV